MLIVMYQKYVRMSSTLNMKRWCRIGWVWATSVNNVAHSKLVPFFSSHAFFRLMFTFHAFSLCTVVVVSRLLLFSDDVFFFIIHYRCAPKRLIVYSCWAVVVTRKHNLHLCCAFFSFSIHTLLLISIYLLLFFCLLITIQSF